MADLAYPTTLSPLPGAIQGHAPERYASIAPAPTPGRLLRDLRHLIPTTGTITDQVVVKAGTVEVPFANALVRVERLADGYRAWSGFSDENGQYTAIGLEIGVEYVMLAIDPTRTHKTTGAGPVMAT